MEKENCVCLAEKQLANLPVCEVDISLTTVSPKAAMLCDTSTTDARRRSVAHGVWCTENTLTEISKCIFTIAA